MIRIGIVEDEILIASSLERNLKKLGLDPVWVAMSYEEAVGMIDSDMPDIVLLDIRIEGKRNGVDVARYLRANHSVPFIFLTSHMDRDTLNEAKDTVPAGYLTKPFQIESLYTTIEVALHNFTHKPAASEMIPLKIGTHIELVPLNEILYLKADHVYVQVVTKAKQHLVRQTLRDFMEAMPKDAFLQVHRSYAVNVNHVVTFGNDSVGLRGIDIPMSKSNREAVFNRLN